jgi:hypothetical protein
LARAKAKEISLLVDPFPLTTGSLPTRESAESQAAVILFLSKECTPAITRVVLSPNVGLKTLERLFREISCVSYSRISSLEVDSEDDIAVAKQVLNTLRTGKTGDRWSAVVIRISRIETCSVQPVENIL